jgi:hypothetical protein
MFGLKFTVFIFGRHYKICSWVINTAYPGVNLAVFSASCQKISGVVLSSAKLQKDENGMEIKGKERKRQIYTQVKEKTNSGSSYLNTEAKRERERERERERVVRK